MPGYSEVFIVLENSFFPSISGLNLICLRKLRHLFEGFNSSFIHTVGIIHTFLLFFNSECCILVCHFITSFIQNDKLLKRSNVKGNID